MASTARTFRSGHQKNIVKMFEGLSGRHSRWEIWSDWIVMSAIAISNLTDLVHREEREKMYMTLSGKYTENEMTVFAQMFAEIVNGFDENPDQDFLGELYMGLELGNDHAGQFFTPYCICSMMAQITHTEDLKTKLEAQGWIGVSDPACGAGALLVAFANYCRQPEININYQTSVLFVAQDIDFIVGCMCYLQLSILGCPGYVVIADSLRYPSVSYDKRGLIPVEKDRDIWYTPFYFRNEWQIRQIAARFAVLSGGDSAPETAVPETAAEPAEEKEPAAETECPALEEERKEQPVSAAPEPEPEEYFSYEKGGQLTLF